MPFTSGTARTPSELLNAINTHLVANGWTKLRGETDMACASPKAARYWRILVWESQSTTSTIRGIQKVELRTTAGGANQATTSANWTSSSVGTGTPSLLVAGGTFRSAVINNQPWWVEYDFGSATTVREVLITGDATIANSPRDFALQWSNDGLTWTTMVEYTGQTWIVSEVKTFTLTDGFLFSRHVAASAPRRSGQNEAFTINSDFTGTSARDFSEDIWIWQAPGYDAARRVFISARGQCREASNTNMIEWDFHIGYSAALKAWNSQDGNTALSRSHMMDSNTVNYWIYSNSKRLILITRSGAQDYTSTYIGFMSAFAVPDDYPFPLLLSTTGPDSTTFSSGQVNARLSMCADPGINAAIARLWDGVLVNVGNRPDDAASNRYLQFPTTSWVWPYHTGATNRPVWPFGWGSDYADYLAAHAFDYFVATVQNDLPLIPCTVQHGTYGNIGVMDGVFAIPSGGILTALQVLTIGGVNYRIFPNRTRREQVSWMAIRED